MAISTTTPPTIKVTVPQPVATVTSYTYRGSTVTFNKPAQVQVSANGDPMIVKDAGLQIIAMSPVSQVQDGYIANGVMTNPHIPPIQGYDEYHGVPDKDSSTTFPYSSTVNTHPNINGPIDCSVAATHVHNYRKTTNTLPVLAQGMIDKYVPWSVIDAPAPAGSFRPSVSGTNKAITRNVSDIRLNVFRNVTQPTGSRGLVAAKDLSDLRKCIPHWWAQSPVNGEIYGAERNRRQETDPAGGYGSNRAIDQAEDMLAINWTASDAEKLPLAIHFAQQAIDMTGHYERGGRGTAGAGQSGVQTIYLILGGFMFGDTALLNMAKEVKTNFLGQPFTVEDKHIGVPYPYSDGDRYFQSYTPRLLGLSEWAHSFVSILNADNNARYRSVASPMVFMEGMVVCLLQNGPGGINGAQWLYDNFPATFEQIDKIYTYFPLDYSSMARFNDYFRTIYAAIRPLWTPAIRAEVPQTLKSDKDHIVGVANGFSVNFRGCLYSKSAVTNRKARISIDRRSWKRFTGLADTQIITGNTTIGQKYWFSVGQDNATGLGDWHRSDSSSTTKGGLYKEPTFTPSGTALTTIPVNASPPVVAIRILPWWRGPAFEDCPTPVPVGTHRLYVALGDWFGGGPLTSANWKIRADGVDISGVAGNVLLADFGKMDWGFVDLDASLRGKTITVGVQGVNAAGTSAWVYSSGVAVPSTVPTTGFLVPETGISVPIKYVTERWNSGSSVLSFFSGALETIAVSGGSTMPDGNYFWSIDTLPPLGDLSNVPQGDMWMRDGGTAGASNVWPKRQGFVIYGSGNTAATANGYIVELCQTAGQDYFFRVTKVTAGSRAAPVASSGATFPQDIEPSNGDWIFRVNWSIVAGDLVIKCKAWPTEMRPYFPFAEPAFQWTYTDPAATVLPSGRIGFGMVATRAARALAGIGVSTNPAVPAPTKPPVPAYVLT